MNTRQKLTLGIAAIFMVTLTIVGVTYAFFVTRVDTTNGKTTANVQMAELASVDYAEGNGLIIMDDVIPGDVEYKTFRVLNNNTNQSQYSIILASAKPTDAVSFVHTSAANVTDVCYANNAYDTLHSTSEAREADSDLATAYATLNSTCYVEDQNYNSIKYDLYEVTKEEYATFATTDDDANDAVIENVIKAKSATATGNVKEGTGSYTGTKIIVGEPQVVKADITIDAGVADTQGTVTPHEVYYVLKVTYEEEEANQNIENNAALGILVSIQ